MKYTKKKIEKFDEHKIGKTYGEFMARIEAQWDDLAARQELVRNLRQFCEFTESPRGMDRLVAYASLANRSATLDGYLSIAVPLMRILGDEPKDMDMRVMQGDGSGEKTSIPLYGILYNLRSSFNVGSVFRVAECVGIEKLYLTGYTATPENSKVRKTSMGTDAHVGWEYRENFTDVFNSLAKRRIPVVALETVADAPTIFDMEFPRPCAILIGNEAHGIDKDTLKMVDRIVRIPVHGWKNSLNVATSFAVTCYEVVRQWR